MKQSDWLLQVLCQIKMSQSPSFDCTRKFVDGIDSLKHFSSVAQMMLEIVGILD